MQNNLETFVKAHRSEFDTIEPSAAIWQSIDNGIKTPSSSITSSKITWLKSFVFGASVVTGIGYFAIHSSTDALTQKKGTPLKNRTYSGITSTKKDEVTKSNSTHDESISYVMEKVPSTDLKDNSSSLIATASSDENGQTVIKVETFTSPAEKNDVLTTTLPAIPTTPIKPVEAIAPLPPLPPLKPLHPVLGMENGTEITKDTVFMGIKSIEINTTLADVTIQTNDGDQTFLSYSIKSDEKDNKKQKNKEKSEDLPQISYVIKDETLYITLGYGDSNTKRRIQNPKAINLSMDIPKQTNVVVNNTMGDIWVKGIEGNNCTIRNSMGDVKIENTSGEINMIVNSGDLSLNECKGNLEVNMSLGNFTTQHFTGNIKTNITSGDVEISDLTGNIDAENSLGDQKFNHIYGDIKVNSSSGDVKISNSKGNVDISSSLGDIDLENYTGNPTINSNSGDITGTNIELIDNITILNSLGDVNFDLVNKMEDLSFDLKTELGKILIEKDGSMIEDSGTIKIEKGKIKVKGRTNSGTQTFM